MSVLWWENGQHDSSAAGGGAHHSPARPGQGEHSAAVHRWTQTGWGVKWVEFVGRRSQRNFKRRFCFYGNILCVFVLL